MNLLFLICLLFGHQEIRIEGVKQFTFVKMQWAGYEGKFRLVGCSRCHTVYWVLKKEEKVNE